MAEFQLVISGHCTHRGAVPGGLSAIRKLPRPGQVIYRIWQQAIANPLANRQVEGAVARSSFRSRRFLSRGFHLRPQLENDFLQVFNTGKLLAYGRG